MQGFLFLYVKGEMKENYYRIDHKRNRISVGTETPKGTNGRHMKGAYRVIVSFTFP